MDYTKQPRKAAKESTERVKRKVVVKGKATRKPRSVGKRLFDTFVGSDAPDMKTFVVEDVVIPGIKNMISDSVSTVLDTLKDTVEIAIFGETKKKKGSKYTYTPYSSYYDNQRSSRSESTVYRRKSNEVETIIFDSKEDAKEVIANLVDLTIDFGMASVADYYDMVDQDATVTDRNYGWFNFKHGLEVTRVREGYIINLPKPVVLE